jgi:hypothetical protein
MAPQGKKNPQQSKKFNDRFPKLPFHTPSISKSDKALIAERVSKAEINLTHLNTLLTENDWLKVRFDSENGVWLVIHSYTPTGDDEPVGLVTHRAKRIQNAIGMALWAADELSDSDFVSDDDEDF